MHIRVAQPPGRAMRAQLTVLSLILSISSSAAQGYPACTNNPPCPPGGNFYYCQAGRAFNGCRPFTSGPFPAVDCTTQCMTNPPVTASPPRPPPPSPRPPSPPPPSPSPSPPPPASPSPPPPTSPSPPPPNPSPPPPSPSPSPPPPLNTDCPTAVNCPMDGTAYWYCSAGPAQGGCQAASGGPFPTSACNAQCTFSSSNPLYIPPPCPADTANPVPADGQSYYLCTAPTVVWRPITQGWFPAAACTSQCTTAPKTSPAPAPGPTPTTPTPTIAGRTIRVLNKCPYEVWVAAIGNNQDGSRANPALLNGATSWRLGPGSAASPTTLSMNAGALTSGRLWGRTGCGFDATQNRWRCKTGDCDGAQACTLSGTSPATLFEWTFTSTQDIYDMSIVDGYNIPMTINPRNFAAGLPYACTSPTCTLDPATCPPETILQVGGGAPNACLSICAAVYDVAQRSAYPVLQNLFTSTVASSGKPMRDLVCCACGDNCGAGCGCGSPQCNYGCSPYVNTAQYQQPPFSTSLCRVEEWPLATNGQTYITAFKNACPRVYAWQYDDADGLHYCRGADYDITFC